MELRQDAVTTCNLHSLSSLRVGRGGHMSKKHFIALADALKGVRPLDNTPGASLAITYWKDTIDEVAKVCYRFNPQFDRGLWVSYIMGECGPSGGTVKTKVA